MTTLADLIATLRERQRDVGESHRAFAHRLGISRQMWQFIVTGERHPGPDTLQAIGRAYPDLMPQLMAIHMAPFFLASNATNVTSDATNNDTEKVPA